MGDDRVTGRHPAGLLGRCLRAASAVAFRLLPRPFRRAYGDDILELLERRCHEERRRSGRVAALRLYVRNLVDIARTGAAEHRASSFRGPAPPPAPQPKSAHRKGDSIVHSILQDLRFSLRSFRRQPIFIGVIVLTLALGIGANIAVFSVVYGVLLQPLPYEDSEDLIDVWGRFDPESGFDYPIFPLSPPEWVDYRAQSRSMQDVAAFGTSAATLTGGDGEPERVATVPASANLFRVLRVEPMLGRVFNEEEDTTGASVVVLEHGFWRQRFGADEQLVGGTITLNGQPWTVLGIMPEGFAFGTNARMWVPLGIDPGQPGNRQSHFLRAVGRLAPGATLEQAEAEMATLMSAWERDFPQIHTAHYLYLSPMIEDVVGSVRPALLMLLAASGLVLLIVCANVASVLLARGEDRAREIAIRGALGAGRGQIVRLLLGESALLSLAGGLIGGLLAFVGVRALTVAAADSIPRIDAIAIDATVLAFGALVVTTTAVLFGLFPAVHGAGEDVQSRLKEGIGTVTSTRTRLYFRRGLVVAEVALSFMLVLAAGLVLKGFAGVLATDPGFETDGIVFAGVALPQSQYADDAAVQAFFDALLERARGLPGVTSGSVSSAVPVAASQGVWDFRVEGRPLPGPGEPAWNAAFATVRPDFFETLGVRLIRGRTFAPTDTAAAELVTVISHSLAEKFFPGEDPLGLRIMVCCPSQGQESPWMTVVGIVDDVRYEGLDVEPRPAYYAAHSQSQTVSHGNVFRSMGLLVRSEAGAPAVAASLRSLVRELDAALPVIGLRSMDEVIAESVARPRFTTRLLGLFALIALALGATGIYGVLAYMVAQRRREIGIRKALGASHAELAHMVIAHGMGLVALGLLLGAVASYWTTRLLDSLLFGVSNYDLTTYALVSVLLAFVALVACAIPTLRALRVDPLVVLRAD